MEVFDFEFFSPMVFCFVYRSLDGFAGGNSRCARRERETSQLYSIDATRQCLCRGDSIVSLELNQREDWKELNRHVELLTEENSLLVQQNQSMALVTERSQAESVELRKYCYSSKFQFNICLKDCSNSRNLS